MARVWKLGEEQRVPIFIATISLIAHLLLIFVVMLDKTPTGCPPTSPHGPPVFSLPLSRVGHSGHADCHDVAAVSPLVSGCCHLAPLSRLLIIHIVTTKPAFKAAESSHHWVLNGVSVSLPTIPYHLHDGSIFLSFPGKISSWLLI